MNMLTDSTVKYYSLACVSHHLDVTEAITSGKAIASAVPVFPCSLFTLLSFSIHQKLKAAVHQGVLKCVTDYTHGNT